MASIPMASFTPGSVVCLYSRYRKYLIAKKDKISVSQGPDGLQDCAKWTIEGASEGNIRLRSWYGTYLTASTGTFCLVGAGCKVIQSQPCNLDSSVEWTPRRNGKAQRLQTASGSFLRANGGIPPYRNSVTHDIPLWRASNLDIDWDVTTVGSTSQPDDGDAERVPPVRSPSKPQPVNPGGKNRDVWRGARDALDMVSDAANVAGFVAGTCGSANPASDGIAPDEDEDEDA